MRPTSLNFFFSAAANGNQTALSQCIASYCWENGRQELRIVEMVGCEEKAEPVVMLQHA